MIPKGYKLLFIYIAWAVLVSGFAVVILRSGNTTLNDVIQKLLSISALAGIIVFVLLVVSILFERKIAENPRHNTEGKIKKKTQVGNRVTDLNGSINIPDGLAYKCQSKDCKRNTGKCCNNTSYKPKLTHLASGALCSTRHIISKKGAVKKSDNLNSD